MVKSERKGRYGVGFAVTTDSSARNMSTSAFKIGKEATDYKPDHFLGVTVRLAHCYYVCLECGLRIGLKANPG